MFDLIKDLLNRFQSGNALARIDNVKTNVPPGARYVTLVQAGISQGPIELSSSDTKISGASDTLIGVDVASLRSAYMLHDGINLQFISEDQKLLLSTPMSNIAELRSIFSMKPSATFGNARGGFVCSLRDGLNIVISTPSPVVTDNTSQYRTISGLTDITGGWAKELKQFGIITTY